MAQVLIVEDEFFIAEHLRTIVTGLGHHVVGVADSAAQALELVHGLPHPPTLALLDITLNGELDGIDLAARLRARYGVPCVFVTSLADPETVARAKQATPLGYLLKPFVQQEVYVTLEMALAALAVTTAAPAAPEPAGLFVRDHKQLVRVDFVDLCWLEADSNYTKLYTCSGKHYTTTMPFKQVEARLPAAAFLRIHKSHIVALAHITALAGQAVVVAGHQVPIGRAYHAALFSRLNLLKSADL
ncbi:LytR/AlgR family response regulator transcription factor [Hymenobacter antarcticus]